LLFLDRIGILERTQEALEREIEGLQEQAGATERALVLAEEELLSAQHLSEQSLVTRPRVIALERDKAQLQGALGSYRASIGSAHQRIEEAKLRLSELRASSSTEIVEQLRDSRARAYELAQRLAAAQDVMSRTEVHAPISGEVVGMQIHTLGGVVGGGQPLLDIVPRGDRLIIHAMIDPLDIDSVSVGMPATVWVSAVNRRSSAALEGEVKVISADRLMDGQTGLPYYLARVELMPETLERAAVPIQQGMTVEVMIRTGTWTAWEYISAPIRRNLSRALRES
jgi:membrane fusion protein, epimerase transport system